MAKAAEEPTDWSFALAASVVTRSVVTRSARRLCQQAFGDIDLRQAGSSAPPAGVGCAPGGLLCRAPAPECLLAYSDPTQHPPASCSFILAQGTARQDDGYEAITILQQGRAPDGPLVSAPLPLGPSAAGRAMEREAVVCVTERTPDRCGGPCMALHDACSAIRPTAAGTTVSPCPAPPSRELTRLPNPLMRPAATSWQTGASCGPPTGWAGCWPRRWRSGRRGAVPACWARCWWRAPELSPQWMSTGSASGPARCLHRCVDARGERWVGGRLGLSPAGTSAAAPAPQATASCLLCPCPSADRPRIGAAHGGEWGRGGSRC